MQFSLVDLSFAEQTMINNNDVINIERWSKRINDRLTELHPLIHELTIKGINLIDLSKDLNHEYNTLIMIKRNYRL